MGGNAFKDITRRVTKSEVYETSQWVADNWPDFQGSILDCLLGSAGKNSESGDIDINVNEALYDFDTLSDHFTSLLGSEYVKSRPGNNQIFMAVPIIGDTTSRVQVDLMFGNFEWQKFSYFSPYQIDNTPGHKNSRNSSSYKGLYRTELLKAITAYGSDWVLEEDGEVIARVGPTFFHDRGCIWRYRHRPMRLDGTARVKDYKELTKDEFLAIYPGAITARTDKINKVADFIKVFFPHYHYARETDLQNFESIWNLVRYYSNDHQTIAKIYLERLNSLNVEIPTDFSSLGIKVK